MSLKGIDVSTWQGKIDWEKVKADGIEFAMIRAGFGNNNIDQWFKRNIEECNRLGIPCGVYWFSYAYTEEMAKREARQCLAAIKPYRVEYPVCYDFEYGSVDYARKKGVAITKALATSFAEAFCDEVEKAGYYAMNYTNRDYIKKYFDMSILKKYDIWLALWPSSKKPDVDRSGECGLWQYTDKGTVEGISGPVDMNIAYKDYPAIVRNKGLNGFVAEPEAKPAPEPEPVPEVKPEPEPIAEPKLSVYVVKKGDTLLEIALDHNTTVKELVRLNNIKNPDLIYPNQKLKVPTVKKVVEKKKIYHTVVKGDTVWDIAQKYGSSVREIESFNDLRNVNLISPGQKLRVK